MGWNGSDRASGKATATVPPPPVRKPAPSRWRGLVACLIVVGGVAAALWFFVLKNQDAAPKTSRRDSTSTRRIPSAKPSPAKTAPESNDTGTNPSASKKPIASEPASAPRQPSASETDKAVQTNADQAASKDLHGHNPTFRNGVEQLLDMVTPSAPGVRIPPLPVITDEGMKEDLKRALKHIPKATEADTEDTIRRKLAVEDRKDEFLEVNKQTGMSITEYVQAVRDQHNDNADFMAEAHKLDQEVKNDTTVSDADYKNTHDQINKALEERGLPKIESEVDESPSDGKESAP